MSKNQTPISSSGNSRGDVSFIRATSNPGPSPSSSSVNLPNSNQNAEKLPAQHFYATSNPPISSQESAHHHHHHQQQPLSRQHPHQQQLHMMQYLPEHMDALQYVPKQSHGAGGASGDSVRISSHTGVEGWSDREEALVAELEEAKIRVAQMEKTMRWWSDCTSDWRMKWNKARNERNKAREENRLLRSKLESLAKDLLCLKREKKEIEKESTPEDSLQPSSKSQDQAELSEKEKTVIAGANEKESESLENLSEITSSKSKQTLDGNDEKDMDDVEHLTVGEDSQSSGSLVLATEMADKLTQMQDKQALLEEELSQALAKASHATENSVMMQRKLDEANNTIQAERLEKCSHIKVIEQLQKLVEDMKTHAEDSDQSIQNLKKELEKTKEEHAEEMARLTLDLEDETCSRSTMDRRITELRRELERIQAENASEWAKRERLESEKIALERDNKKLRSQISDLEEEVDKQSQTSSFAVDSDLKTLQFELTEKNKEVSDLRHMHSKLKKLLTERNTELDHTRRRAEQYETEVRKLRSRVDELKHDLASAEDEVDNQGNAARKAQRTNDELQAQVESLQVQVNHLQSRLRSSKHVGVTTPRSTSLKSLTLEDSAELADSENDYDDI